MHTAARIINDQVSAYTQKHNPELAARQLDALTPLNHKLESDEGPESIESFLCEFWEIVVNLSQAYTQNSEQAQARIVEILEHLKSIEARKVTIWGPPAQFLEKSAFIWTCAW